MLADLYQRYLINNESNKLILMIDEFEYYLKRTESIKRLFSVRNYKSALEICIELLKINNNKENLFLWQGNYYIVKKLNVYIN